MLSRGLVLDLLATCISVFTPLMRFFDSMTDFYPSLFPIKHNNIPGLKNRILCDYQKCQQGFDFLFMSFRKGILYPLSIRINFYWNKPILSYIHRSTTPCTREADNNKRGIFEKQKFFRFLFKLFRNCARMKENVLLYETTFI